MKDFFRTGEALGVSWFRLYLADSLVSNRLSGDSEKADLLRWLILHAAVQAGAGHMRTDLQSLSTDMSEWYSEGEDLKVPGFNPELPGLLEAVLEEVLDSGKNSGMMGTLADGESTADSLSIPRPPMILSSDNRYLYFLKRRRAEDRLLSLLAGRAAEDAPSLLPSPAELPTGPAGELMRGLSEGRRLLILAGGPGTGKTTTVAILMALVATGRQEAGLPPIAAVLAAPTGRAAARMSEGLATATGDTSLQGRTLHSLLGLAPGRQPRYDRENPLNTELLVVDEASMVDLPMMLRLLEALPPSAALLLVGDPDQLPSVEAGALLGDLLSGEKASPASPLAGSLVRLTRVYRSATAILDAAARVREGDAAGLASAYRENGVSLHEPRSPEESAAAIAGNFRKALNLARGASGGREEQDCVPSGLFEAYAAQAVLTPLRKGPWGVLAMNDAVSRIVAEGSAFPGMPVMVTRNDAGRNLWNGDRGVILSREGRLRAVFPEGGGFREFPLAALPGWEPAWIQTIHKSQGSEFDEVTILLPRGAERLLSREILYTAITRARNRVLLFAEKNVVEATLGRKVLRHSRVREWASGK